MTLKHLWQGVKAFMAAYKVLAVLQLAVPVLLAAWTVFLGYAEALPTAVIVVLGLLALSQAALLIAAGRYIWGVPILTRGVDRLDWVLSFSSVGLAYSPPGRSDPSLQISVLLLNGSRGPLECKVERFDVVIGDSTIGQKRLPEAGFLIPFASQRSWRDAVMRGAVFERLAGGKHEGTVEAHILYRRAGDAKFSRRYKVRLSITVDLSRDGAISDVIESENDEAI